MHPLKPIPSITHHRRKPKHVRRVYVVKDEDEDDENTSVSTQTTVMSMEERVAALLQDIQTRADTPSPRRLKRPLYQPDTEPPPDTPQPRRLKRRLFWSDTELQALIAGIKVVWHPDQLRMDWTRVRDLFPTVLGHRSPMDLKDKWRNLVKTGVMPPMPSAPAAPVPVTASPQPTRHSERPWSLNPIASQYFAQLPQR